MNADGDLNVSTIGSSPEDARRKAAHAQNRQRNKRSSLADLAIKALSIEDGRIYFNDLGEKATPIHVRHLDFDVTNFNAASAFDVETKFAFPGDEQNVEASGKLGTATHSRRAGRIRNSCRSEFEDRFDPARQHQAAG